MCIYIYYLGAYKYDIPQGRVEYIFYYTVTLKVVNKTVINTLHGTNIQLSNGRNIRLV